MPAAPLITPQDIDAQVRHWLRTPAGSYLGSSYGYNIKDTLQRPMADTNMDDVVAKLVRDVPILSMLPPGSVNVYQMQGNTIDQSTLVIDVAGRAIEVPKG